MELLHNFTLIHDDVQDESPTRRHRPTVWSIWGIGQAINAGDALFAAAHLPLYRLASHGVSAELTLRLLEAFDRMTIAIVEGQTLDLGFESRPDVLPAEYLKMIAGKTAAIVRFAAWSGALLGGADEITAERWAEFGQALGIGFQIRDDLLGIWGMTDATGKAPADDVRRRKQSLPILMLRERLNPCRTSRARPLYAAPNVDGPGVSHVLNSWNGKRSARTSKRRLRGITTKRPRRSLPRPGRARILPETVCSRLSNASPHVLGEVSSVASVRVILPASTHDGVMLNAVKHLRLR